MREEGGGSRGNKERGDKERARVPRGRRLGDRKNREKTEKGFVPDDTSSSQLSAPIDNFLFVRCSMQTSRFCSYSAEPAPYCFSFFPNGLQREKRRCLFKLADVLIAIWSTVSLGDLNEGVIILMSCVGLIDD